MTRPRSDGVSSRMPYSRSPSACGDPQRLLGLVLERVDQDDPRHVRLDVLDRTRAAASTVSPKIRTSECGIVPVGARPASRAPAGVEAPTQPPTIAA